MLEKYIINWIKEQADIRGLKCLLINLSANSAASAYTLYLCKKTQIPTIALIVDGQNSDIASLYASQIGVSACYVDLVYIFNLHKTTLENLKEFAPIETKDILKQLYIQTLAINHDALVVSPRSKIEHLYLRPYFKNEHVDILPLANLNNSAIRKLFNESCLHFPSSKIILSLSPKDEDKSYSINITNKELEELDQLNDRTKIGLHKEGIIHCLFDPAKSTKWFAYTSRQKEIIAKLHQIEKITKHKHNPNIPICDIPKNLI